MVTFGICYAIVVIYDSGGNILTKTEYANATATGEGTTINYGYTDANWGDLLTSYNGSPITYDGSGNPLAMNGWTFTWQGGRQLAGMSNGTTTLSFAYNDSGLRTSKTVGGVTHNYTYQGSTLVADKTTTDALYFHYDQNGSILGFTYDNGTTSADYYYVKNLQGDILGILDASGALVASYTYDAWGNILSVDGSNSALANRNPLRYRGYYYDSETELYYLQSRYYDAAVGRFLNADTYTQTYETGNGANMFAYCLNNPISRTDAGGKSCYWAVDNYGVPYEAHMYSAELYTAIGCAVWENTTVTIGFGFGLGGSVKAADVGAELLIYANLIEYEISADGVQSQRSVHASGSLSATSYASVDLDLYCINRGNELETNANPVTFSLGKLGKGTFTLFNIQLYEGIGLTFTGEIDTVGLIQDMEEIF